MLVSGRVVGSSLGTKSLQTCLQNLGVVTVREGGSNHRFPNQIPCRNAALFVWLSAICTKNTFDHDWPVAGHVDVLSGSSCFPHSLVLIMSCKCKLFSISLAVYLFSRDIDSMNINNSWQISAEIYIRRELHECIFWFQEHTMFPPCSFQETSIPTIHFQAQTCC